MYSHIINGHYMYGNTFIQPEMVHYKNIPMHAMAPIIRNIPPYPDVDMCTACHHVNINDDGIAYTNPDDESQTCDCDCPVCVKEIIRDPMALNVVNIETSIVKTLKITLYGITKDKDVTIEMKQGGRYAVTYVTESGLITSIGYLELISTSIPDTCTRYIGGANSQVTAANAYIGMDCSTEGHSNKCKIYISTIRNIQVLKDGEQVETEDAKTTKERLNELLSKIESGELVFCNKETCMNSSSDNSTDSSDEDTTTDNPNGENVDSNSSENTVTDATSSDNDNSKEESNSSDIDIT